MILHEALRGFVATAEFLINLQHSPVVPRH